MPTRLLVLDEAAATSTERWIERPFLTIGTDSGSDVPLAAGGEEVRIYLQFRDGRYEVFNKHAGEVRLDGRAVPVGTSAAWEPGVEIEAGGHRFRLLVEGDPAPGPRPLASAPRPVREPLREPARAGQAMPAPTAGQDPGPPADRSRAIKLAVIVACLAASSLLLVRDRILSPSAVKVSDPEAVTALIKDGFAAETRATGAAAELRHRLARRLQWAETAWLQGDYPLAAERYAAIKQHLAGFRLAKAAGANPANVDDWQARLKAHVDARIADLPGE